MLIFNKMRVFYRFSLGLLMIFILQHTNDVTAKSAVKPLLGSTTGTNNIQSDKFTNVLSIIEFVGSIFYNLFYGSIALLFVILTVILFVKRESFNFEVDENFNQLNWKMKIMNIFSNIPSC